MKIFEYSNGEIEEQKSLIEALKIDINTKRTISFVGGGGKTSLIYELGNELKKLGKKVIITTTACMFIPEDNVVLTGRKIDIIEVLCHENIVTVGMLDAHKKGNFDKGQLKDKDRSDNFKEKICGLQKEIAESLIELADFVLVEADGSRRLPLKVPAEHEPVILNGSDLVVGVCGINAIGKSIKEICHRSNLVSGFLNTDEEHIVSPGDAAKILSSSKGTRKNVTGSYKVIINKADTVEELEKAKEVSKELINFGVKKAIITTFRNID